MFYLYCEKFPILHLTKSDRKISFQSFGRLLSLGIPMGLQFSITAIGTIIVQGAVNVYGETYMAGFSAAGKLQNMIMTVFVAFGATVATYVGQNRGAGRMDRVKSGVRCTQVMILVWSVIAMVAVCFGGKYMTWLFIDPSETEVVNVSVLYFRTVFWCYPFLGSIFYTGIRFREWDMDLFPCWEVFLNLQQEVRLLWRLPEGQLFRECVSPIRRHGSLR